MDGEPGLGGATQPPHLLRPDHLERVADADSALRLDFAEDDRPPTADDKVDLVPAGPDVRA